MNSKYRLVVFDWEGTISDTLGQIINCVAKEAKRLNFGELDESRARQYVELGLVNAVRKIYPLLSADEHAQLLAAVQQSLYAKNSEIYLNPGILELLNYLSDNQVFLAIASNKSQQGLQRALQTTGLEHFFKVIRTASYAPAKPCPQMLQEIMEEFSVNAGETIMIGDSVADIEMAQNIQVDAIGVDFYHQQEEVLRQAGALAVFQNFNQVADFFNLSPKELL